MTGYIDNIDCGVYDVDSDGDNDNNDADKDNYGDKKMLIVLVMMNEVIMLVVMLKMVLEMMLMIKMILIFDNGVKGEFLQFSFASISTTYDSNLSFPDSIRCK